MTKKMVVLVNDHSHAMYLHTLQKQLKTEYLDKGYTYREHQKIKSVIEILHKKEEKIKSKHKTEAWNELGDYRLWR